MRGEDEVTLTLLHTADWHLGKRFTGFEQEPDRNRLTRARLEVVDNILDLAARHAVDAILCAGDVFDEPQPARTYWEGLAQRLTRADPSRPIFLLPGNHDPLRRDSVYDPSHPFRASLPPFVKVVDTRNFTAPLKDAVLVASPCTSAAGQEDLALALPAREPGDDRLRVGMVHGSTFDLPRYEANFPIARNAAVLRGFDYLAIGDTHAFRDVQPDSPVPVVYPGTPETTTFGETDTGYVAIVRLTRRGRRPHVLRERVGRWRWRDETLQDMASLRRLHESASPQDVLRLRLDLAVTIQERHEVEQILAELRGTEAISPRAGVVEVDTQNLRLVADAVEGEFPHDLPSTLAQAVALLRQRAASPTEGEQAKTALYHLWKIVHGRG